MTERGDPVGRGALCDLGQAREDLVEVDEDDGVGFAQEPPEALEVFATEELPVALRRADRERRAPTAASFRFTQSCQRGPAKGQPASGSASLRRSSYSSLRVQYPYPFLEV